MTDVIFLPMIVVASIGVAWAAYSAFAMIRIVAWGSAGLGLGLIIARVTGIPHSMIFLPPTVMGLVLSVVGYHAARETRS